MFRYLLLCVSRLSYIWKNAKDWSPLFLEYWPEIFCYSSHFSPTFINPLTHILNMTFYTSVGENACENFFLLLFFILVKGTNYLLWVISSLFVQCFQGCLLQISQTASECWKLLTLDRIRYCYCFIKCRIISYLNYSLKKSLNNTEPGVANCIVINLRIC